MKKLKEGFGKFLKGMFGIFVLKVMLLGVFLVYQACETDDTPSIELQAKENFMSSIRKGTDKVSKIEVRKMKTEDLDMFQRTEINAVVDQQDDETVICTKEEILPNDDNETQGNIITLVDFTSVNLNTKDENNTIDEEDHCYAFSTVEVEEAMEPSLNDAKAYLYSKGLTDGDIEELLAADEEGPAIHESALVPAVMALIAEEEHQNSLASSVNFTSLFIFETHASSYQENDLYDCVMRTLGVTALTEAFNKGLSSSAGKKALKKAVRKIATKTLGWVGAAWAAYEFGDCMGWW